MISEGKKIAKATGIRFIKPKDTLAFQVAFQFDERNEQGGGVHTLYWNGYTSAAAQPITIKTLSEVLEWTGDDEVLNVPETDPKFGWLKNQDCINRKKDVELVVEHESYTDKEGVARKAARIKWVNNVGGGQFAGVSPEVIKNDLDASGFKARFLSSKKPQAGATLAPAPMMTDDLPF